MVDKLKEAIAHIEEAHKILVGFIPKEKETPEKPNKKVTIEFKIKNPYDGAEISEDDLKELRKDLEEIINDFTRE